MQTVQIAEIECEICGKYFTPTTHNRKYCDDCSPHSDIAKARQARALKSSIRRLYTPEILSFTCKECGRDFKTTRKLIIHPGYNYDHTLEIH